MSKKIDDKKIEKNPRNMIIAVLVVSIVVIGVFLFANRRTDVDKVSMPYHEVFDNDILKANVRTSFKQTYGLKDYTIYGETLILYEEPYVMTEVDGLLGKSIVLRNVATEEELIFSFTGGIDSGIDLGMLDEGMYEIYVYDHYKKKRVFFEDEFSSEQFVTLRRDGKVKMVTLNTEKDYLEDIGVEMDQNYAFLTVIENTAVASVYDVVLDPSGYVIDIATNNVDYGIITETFKEYEESYNFALKIKQYLENKGLRVLITRDADETKAYYGKNGRAGLAYDSGAKLFISLGAYQDDETQSPYIVTSPYTSAMLANEVAYYLKENNIIMDWVSFDDQLQRGVAFDSFHQEYEANLGYYIDTEFELLPQIRETGGKLTMAGTMVNAAENQMFTDDYGLYGLFIYYTNATNPDSLAQYEATKDLLAKRIVEGICQYYQIK